MGPTAPALHKKSRAFISSTALMRAMLYTVPAIARARDPLDTALGPLLAANRRVRQISCGLHIGHAAIIRGCEELLTSTEEFAIVPGRR